ncbi:hypothetical protein DSM104443_00188 [Usitatibacter rugosus]|uniref:Alginate export domain-containing protein n=2 Tax=Usitatibacter rugosus TaxID=2732067 RepID=A0A6M4GPN4_9PROT|nr:hypothetical protein DSM104443_00188 [Usitatibacter rugosus]
MDALQGGRAIVELRPRYNRIEESDKPLTSEGFTYRAIFGWASAPWQDLRLTAELINTGHIGPKKYNDDGALIRTSPYPLLPDPDSTDVNRAFIDYTGIASTRLRAGRQLVRMDNQRWVSDNDFRNTPQLFDGVAGTNTSIANVELHASYYWRQRTTNGTSAPLNLTLLHAAWNPAPEHALGAYAYFHDQAVNGAFTGFADNSYRVTGVRAEGAFRGVVPFDVVYTAEAAAQRPYSGGDSRIDANYWRLGGGASADAWTIRYDYEVKGSNDGVYGLQMPLTDFYGFNGWTLHFFNTPPRGLRDQWLTGRFRAGAFTLYGETHRFKSDFGSLDYGKEDDVGLTWQAMDGLALRLQHARYRPGTAQPPQPRITKTWATLTYTY